MVNWQKIKVCLAAATMCLFFAIPCAAVEQDLVVTLEKAKKLAKNNARILQTMEYTNDKLEAESDVAYDTYMSYSLQNQIKGYRYRINQLNKEIEGLNPENDSDRIMEIMGKIDQYEHMITYLNANKPDESLVKNFKLAWRMTDEAYKDMAKTKEKSEKSIELGVENFYFALLDLQNTIDLQNTNLENSGKQLRIERLKIELGLSNAENEKFLVTQYTMLKNAIDDLKRKHDLLRWQLNDLMGRELNAALQAVEEEVLPVKVFYATDTIYEQAVKNSLEVAKKERQIENAEKDLASEKNRDQREILKQGKKIAQNELIDLEVGLKEKVKSLIDQLEAGYSAWHIAVKEKEQAKISHEYNEIEFKLGIISELQRDLSKAAYLEAVHKEKQTAKAWQIVNQQLALAKEGIFE